MYQLDYVLVMSWLFVIFCGGYFVAKSSQFRQFVESIRNTWREAEAHHEHID